MFCEPVPVAISIGADPEFFIRKRQHFVSGHIFECGTKDKPQPTEHGSVQVDGVALECNVRPAKTKQEFIQNTTGVISDLERLIKVKSPDHSLVTRPAVFFGNKKLAALPEEIGKLGCTPDFNAYTRAQNLAPDSTLPIRTGSGHVHIGWTNVVNPREKKHFDLCCAIVKELDYYLGLPSLLWDKDRRRRSLYGKAGAFRPKPYGLEYRVLSNKWLETPGLMGYVFDQSIRAVNSVMEKDTLFSAYGLAAQSCINSSYVWWRESYPSLAKEILR